MYFVKLRSHKVASEKNAPQLITKKLGKIVKSHVHAGAELKAGDEIKLTQVQITRLQEQFGPEYFEG